MPTQLLSSALPSSGKQQRTPRQPSRRVACVALLAAALLLAPPLALDADAQTPPWRIRLNEQAAMKHLNTIRQAAFQYAQTYGQGFPPSLASLGPPPRGVPPGPFAAGLIDGDLAAGLKSGYFFTYSVSDSTGSGMLDFFTINADPITVGTTGKRFFIIDSASGIIRFSRASRATLTDPPVS